TPGKAVKVVSTKTKELTTDGLEYKDLPLVTGDESRGAEVTGVAFPKLLDPIDDLAPTTVVTHVRREGTRCVVRGTTADNGVVKRVVVNGKEAKPTRPN